MTSKWAESDTESEAEEEPQVEVEEEEEVVASHEEPVVAESEREPEKPRLLAGENTVGMISGLPFKATPMMIERWLTSLGIEWNKLDGQKNPKGDFSGRVVVYTKGPQYLQILLDQHETTFGGRTLLAKVYEERPPRGGGGDRDRDRERGGRGGRGGYGERDRDTPRDRERGPRYGPPAAEKERERPVDRVVVLEREKGPEKERERKPLEIAPRTKPLEERHRLPQRDIFGGAKPRDEFEYAERRKRELEREKELEKEKEKEKEKAAPAVVVEVLKRESEKEKEKERETPKEIVVSELVERVENGLLIEPPSPSASAAAEEGERETPTGSQTHTTHKRHQRGGKKETFGPGTERPKRERGDREKQHKERDTVGKEGEKEKEKSPKEYVKKDKPHHKKNNKDAVVEPAPVVVEPPAPPAQEEDGDFVTVKRGTRPPKTAEREKKKPAATQAPAPAPTQAAPLPVPPKKVPTPKTRPVSQFSALADDSDEE